MESNKGSRYGRGNFLSLFDKIKCVKKRMFLIQLLCFWKKNYKNNFFYYQYFDFSGIINKNKKEFCFHKRKQMRGRRPELRGDFLSPSLLPFNKEDIKWAKK